MNPEFLTDPALFRPLAKCVRNRAVLLPDTEGNVRNGNG